MLMHSKSNQKSEKIVNKSVILTVDDTFGLNNQKTLKRMNNFLNLFPLVRVLLDSNQISLHNFINSLVLLNENKQQVMSRLPDLSLDKTIYTFSSDSNAITC